MAQKAFALLCIMDFAWRGQDLSPDKSLLLLDSLVTPLIWQWEQKLSAFPVLAVLQVFNKEWVFHLQDLEELLLGLGPFFLS